MDCLKNSAANFTSDPAGIPMISARARIRAAIPDFQDRLNEAVEEDNRV